MRIRRTLVTAALGGTLALTAMAAPAQAAPAVHSTSAATDATAASDDIPEPPDMIGVYSTRSECESVGVNGDIHGRWSWWVCSRTLRGYELWVVWNE